MNYIISLIQFITYTLMVPTCELLEEVAYVVLNITEKGMTEYIPTLVFFIFTLFLWKLGNLLVYF